MSAFFSCAETAFMASNRYRLKHAANLKKRTAIITLHLLQRPDRLLGLLLVGNTLANVGTASIVTYLTIAMWEPEHVWFTTLILTIVLLVFAETAPKTLASLYPEKLSRLVVLPIYYLCKIFRPFIYIINFLANNTLRICGFKIVNPSAESLSDDELRTVIYESNSKFSPYYQNMLLRVIDLRTLTVNDIMIAGHEIQGLDISLPWEKLSVQLANMKNDWTPVYRENVNQILGVLHSSDLVGSLLMNEKIDNVEQLINLVRVPYFIPEKTKLNMQLHNFKLKRELVAFVVDEYGEVLGMITMDDILAEIVGEFTFALNDFVKIMQWQEDGSCLVEGLVPVRDFNRFTNWQLPTRGSRTINGLITDYLEALPRSGVGLLIAHHPIEIVSAKNNRVQLARIMPRLSLRQQ